MYYGGAHQTIGKAGSSISQFSEKNTSPGNGPVESSSGKIFCSRAGGQVVSEIERLPPREGFSPARKALLDQALQGSSPEVFFTLQTAQPMTNRNSMQMRQSNLVVSVRPRPPVPVSPEISFKFGGRKINSSRVRKSRSSNRHRKHLKPLNLLRSPLQKPVSRGCGQAVDENAGNSTADIDRSMPNSVTTKPMKVEGLRRRSSGAERITR
ncbi:uncharacterized protein LOC120425644 isoform X1 [Culex pipiens pallens]|uniref:(northern house mosquito) hypothetical protein n=1 Tax=Culex pipiens TaxID=7175 RepID=A0A8D8APE3_CULPI|nr:uncharacterized protein LOC120425644 isoform X1 [Culex pipiens pallens]